MEANAATRGQYLALSKDCFRFTDGSSSFLWCYGWGAS